MENIKYYKVISKDNKSIHGGEFDWTKYLPKNNKPGKWTPKTITSMCNSGYHITKHWNMWYEKECRIFEVEYKNKLEYSIISIEEKICCEQIRLIKECFFEFDDNSNTGDSNTGNRNTGDSNTGDINTGNRNTGNRNTGNSNTGYWNTGHWNTGDWNTGHWNTGHSNTGDSNTGNRNTGDSNTGDSNTGNINTGHSNTGDINTGHRNTGDRNTGNSNTGYWNTGDWNTGDSNTGFFNTITPDEILVFNKKCKKSEWDDAQKPNFIYFDLDEKIGYQKSFQKSFKEAPKEDIELLKKLPNFNKDVFFEISGIKIK
jgi:hypothetical protein